VSVLGPFRISRTGPRGQAPLSIARAKQPLPAVLGLDLAETAEQDGKNINNFKAGDEVYGTAAFDTVAKGTLGRVVVKIDA
jgi:NADPH:quinone reductase-like Zn-dependent oxidoreductase